MARSTTGARQVLGAAHSASLCSRQWRLVLSELEAEHAKFRSVRAELAEAFREKGWAAVHRARHSTDLHSLRICFDHQGPADQVMERLSTRGKEQNEISNSKSVGGQDGGNSSTPTLAGRRWSTIVVNSLETQ